MVRSLAQGDIRSQDLSQVELPQSFGVAFPRPGAVQWCKAIIYNRMLSDPIGRGHKVVVVNKISQAQHGNSAVAKIYKFGSPPSSSPSPSPSPLGLFGFVLSFC